MAATLRIYEPGRSLHSLPHVRTGGQKMESSERESTTTSNGHVLPSRRDDPDPNPKQRLQTILTSTEDRPLKSRKPRSKGYKGPIASKDQIAPIVPLRSDSPPKQPIIWIDGATEHEDCGDEASVQNDSYTRAAEFNPSHTMTVAHTRRNANGTIGSVYSGNKIRHLKKEDGIPLWRKDIQLEFLRCVFDDDTKVFTKAYDGTYGHTFADIYVDAMARSSKTSKILKEKLLADRNSALSMAMVCLLVNVGRMNTTLNFFPEMRAQLRTYHSIPSLQAHQDPNAYKQLQDAPRLKSILKGASEDANQPGTIDKIKALSVPRTNPVNLIFVLSQYAPKISETHFNAPRDFFDLVMRGTLSSRSRAKSFLWLIWWYLESDFSAEHALNNPFGPGQHGTETGGLPLKVPSFEHLTEEQANAENVDTEAEKTYGEMKRQERIRILQEDETVGPPLKKAKKSPLTEDAGIVAISDNELIRTPSPSSAIQPKPNLMDYTGPGVAANGNLDEGTPSLSRFTPTLRRSDFSNTQRLVFKTRFDSLPHSSSPAPPGSGHPVFLGASTNGLGSRRPRPETSHQKAVNINRKMRIEHILHQQILTVYHFVRREKRKANSSFGFMVMKRIKNLPDMYDTEDEASWGPGGLIPNGNEAEEFGEEAVTYKKAIDRAVRRLYREENGPLRGLVKGYRKRKRKVRGFAHDEENEDRSRKRRREDANLGMHEDVIRDEGPREQGLDDLDLDLLGEGRDDDQDDDLDEDSGGEDSEGDDGDMTEEEAIQGL